MKKIIEIIAVICIFAAGFYFGVEYAKAPDSDIYQNATQVKTEQPQDLEANLKINYGGSDIKTFDNIKIEKDQTVFDLTKKIAEANGIELKYKDYGGDMGAFVESIGGKAGDMKNNLYWQYEVNGKYSQTGPSGYKLKGGDSIEWKYEKSNF